jgi:hypothetical protein
MERYVHPTLTAVEIFAQLKQSLGIAIASDEDITKPKPETVKPIYQAIVAFIYDVPKEEVLKLSSEETDGFKQKELQENSWPAVKLYKEIRSIYEHIGYKNDPFRISDLIAPDFKRTRQYLSAFLNFMKFAIEERTTMMNENAEISIASDTEDRNRTINQISSGKSDGY